jgi:protein SCO1/2
MNLEVRLRTAIELHLMLAPALLTCGFVCCAEPPAAREPALRRIGFDQRLDAVLPLDLQFRDEAGQPVQLQEYFHSGRPVILLLGYYGCPMLCGAMLRGTASCLKLLPLNAGSDFELVMVSIDPSETPQLAAAKKAEYLREYKCSGAAAGWHFLTGQTAEIDTLTRASGFRYFYDEHAKQYAHASGIILVTPMGKISRYFLGIEYPARDLRLSLVEASQETIGTVSDQFLLLCYRYDPATGRYGFAIMNAIRIGGALTVALIGAFIGISLLRERRRNQSRTTSKPLQPAGSGK